MNKIASFITSLFQLLCYNNIYIKRGAFVIEDKDGQLFKLLQRSTSDNEYVVNRDRGYKYFLSHDDFINKTKFAKKHSESILDTNLNNRYVEYYCPVRGYIHAIYEGVFKDKLIIKICGFYKAIKSVIFYPFFICIRINDNKYNYNRRFLYLKFEESSVNEIILHTSHYIKSKILHCPNKRSEHNAYNNDYKTLDRNFYAELHSKYPEIISDSYIKSLNNYDLHIRLGAEFFIMNDIIKIIMPV